MSVILLLANAFFFSNKSSQNKWALNIANYISVLLLIAVYEWNQFKLSITLRSKGLVESFVEKNLFDLLVKDTLFCILLSVPN